jgi:hypothetical protein
VGAYVVYDLYWDPLYAFATDAEAERACAERWQGAHYFWVEDATPGDCSDLPYTPKPWDDDE